MQSKLKKKLSVTIMEVINTKKFTSLTSKKRKRMITHQRTKLTRRSISTKNTRKSRMKSRRWKRRLVQRFQKIFKMHPGRKPKTQ